jgi:hypothetical protein
MIRWLKEMLLLSILLVPPMVFFPAICWSLALRPHRDATLVCVFFGPLSAGFWVLVQQRNIQRAPQHVGRRESSEGSRTLLDGTRARRGRRPVLEAQRRRCVSSALDRTRWSQTAVTVEATNVA